jgi:uncharacterized protein YdcH (DUF465 family)
VDDGSEGIICVRCSRILLPVLPSISHRNPQRRAFLGGAFSHGLGKVKRSNLMFEHRQDVMEKLMKEDEDFRRIFNRHQELDKRVTAAELGTAPMEDLALNQLKKEKLWAKDRLARIMDSATA